MTLINLDVLETMLTAPGLVASGSVSAMYWAGDRPYIHVADDDVVFPTKIEVEVAAGEPVTALDLPPTNGLCCVWWMIRNNRTGAQLRRFTSIPDVPVVDFGDLPIVDPASFEPVEPTPTLIQTIDSRVDAAVPGAVADYLTENPPASAPDASTTVKGIVQLAGDLGGTADAPTVPGLAGKAAIGHTHVVGDVSGLGTAATTAASDYATAAQGGKADSASQPGHTHTVGDVTGLGTAATTDATDYATAAQGAKADTASQPGHTHTTGEITGLGTAAVAATTDFATATQGGKADTAVQPGALANVATSGDYDDLSGKPTLGTAAAADTGDFAAASHSHTASQISDSTSVGRGVLTAADQGAARNAIGAGTSNLVLGSGGSDAAAGNHTHTLDALSDVDAGTPSNGDALVFNSTSGNWEPDTISGGGSSEFELRGLVSPNGFVTADPGTYYTNTNGTNGAWRWLKKSGTGNTGWECVIGDTGWRDITKPSLSGLTLTIFRLRRINSSVIWVVTDASTSATGTYQLSATITGFKNAGWDWTDLFDDGGKVEGSIGHSSSSGLRLVVAQSGPFQSASLRYETAEQWPASLPGTPA